MLRKNSTSNHGQRVTNQQGQTLLEITIAIAILGWIIVTAVSSYVNLATSQLRSRLKTQATQYAREGLEISYNISLHDWVTFETYNDDFHPALFSGIYELVTGSEIIANKFERTIHIQPAHRDVHGNIDDAGPVVDPDTMKVTSTVVIDSPTTNQEIKLTSYLIDLENI